MVGRFRERIPVCVVLSLLVVSALLFPVASSQASSCLWVSSYHPGYEWNDGIEAGLKSALQGKCDLHTFHMDTKRNTDKEFCIKKGAEAFALVNSLKPDIVIASDNNVSECFVKPYLKNAETPVVFCGVNWSVEEYGYPYANTTGMVEVSPIQPLVNTLQKTIKEPSRGLYLSANVVTERIEYSWHKRLYAKQHITIDSYFANSMEEWKKGYLSGQEYDFIILGVYVGINDWDMPEAVRFVKKLGGKLTVSNYDWMMPIAMLATTKIPEEQGEWAGSVALEILGGVDPADIPIVPNRKWNLLINPELLAGAGFKITQDIQSNAIKVQP